MKACVLHSWLGTHSESANLRPAAHFPHITSAAEVTSIHAIMMVVLICIYCVCVVKLLLWCISILTFSNPVSPLLPTICNLSYQTFLAFFPQSLFCYLLKFVFIPWTTCSSWMTLVLLLPVFCWCFIGKARWTQLTPIFQLLVQHI